MPGKVSMLNKTFARLTVVAECDVLDDSGQYVWHCECSCGGNATVKGYDLRAGKVRSCGCLLTGHCLKASAMGADATRLYCRPRNDITRQSWRAMVFRCTNPNAQEYAQYGGAGIKVCDRWLGADGLKAFIEDLGDRPNIKYSIDRMDNALGYFPGNCKWSTHKEQVQNRAVTIWLTVDGVKRTLSEWADYTGIIYGTLYGRYKWGWSHFDIVSTPVQQRTHKV